MDRQAHSLLLVIILQLKCKGECVILVFPSFMCRMKVSCVPGQLSPALSYHHAAQDPCSGNYVALDPIPVGNSVDLPCGCSPGATTVSWYKDGNQTIVQNTFTFMDIYTVLVRSDEDGGYYSCHCDAHSKCFLLKGKATGM